MTYQQELIASPSFENSPSKPAHSFDYRLRLIAVLVKREIEGRYKGSGLGLLWSLLIPLLMLGVYTFVFGTIFRSRWSTSSDNASPAEFAVILFVGLILFQVFSETIVRSPTLMLNNTSYVKRVVFPLEILVPVALGTSLFHAGVSLLVLFPFLLVVFGGIPWTALLLPLPVIPLLLLTLGLSWFLASVGTFLRDIGQFVSTLMTVVLFLAPIFFPLSALPDWVRPWLVLNPLSLPVEQAREVLIFGRLPDFVAIGRYALFSLLICLSGYIWFQNTRKGFADVI